VLSSVGSHRDNVMGRRTVVVEAVLFDVPFSSSSVFLEPEQPVKTAESIKIKLINTQISFLLIGNPPRIECKKV
jgi:hypothetical protein